MTEVRQWLGISRLLTLTGTGGCGKTRLALEVASELLPDYADGVWLVELAALTDPSLVGAALTATLGLRDQPDQPSLTGLVEALRSQCLLLVLDNCEHLLDACAQVADRLLRSCPQVRILATSREALGLPGEVTWRVPSLSVPPAEPAQSVEQLASYAAVRLFVDRTRAVQPAFRLTQQTGAAIAQICRQLDGIPLAIELAAARIEGLSVEQLAARLDQRFRLLTSGSRTALPRQQTLRATVAWSEQLLSHAERLLFARLAIFTGSFELEAAEAVCADGTVKATEVLDLLLQLVHKSLVLAEAAGSSAVRYRLLETLRQYGRERLDETGQTCTIQDRHAAYYLALVERTEPQTYAAETRGSALANLQREHHNLRAALQWLHEQEDHERALRLAAALANFWFHRGHMGEGRAWLVRLLTPGSEHAANSDAALAHARAKARHGVGRIALWQGDLALAQSLFAENLPFYRAVEDRWETAHALFWLGLVAEAQGDYATARTSFDACLIIYQELGDQTAIGWALRALGFLACSTEEYGTAHARLAEALQVMQALEEPYELAAVLLMLGQLAYQQGQYAAAQAHLAESLALLHQVEASSSSGTVLMALGHLEVATGQLARGHEHLNQALAIHADTGNWLFGTATLEGLARLAARLGQPERALRLAGATAALRERMGAPLAPFPARQLEQDLAVARQALDAQQAAAAWTAGRDLLLEQAVAEARAVERPATASPVELINNIVPSQAEPLTQREREVAVLVASGLTNAEIALELAIAERTARTHVSNILGKLGLANRAQLAVWAVAHDLAPEPRGK